MQVDTDPVVVFRTAAERFASLVDAAEPGHPDTLFPIVAASLADLYSAAIELPNLSPETDEAAEGMIDETWNATLERIQAALGPRDWYWTVVPFGEHANPGLLTGSLADDLADVYRDLRNGLDQLAAGTAVSDVVFEWRLLFWGHWGEHAVNALRIIHRHLAVGDVVQPRG